MASDLPNVVLITTHDLGRHLGCYGASTVRSPSLDSLANQGVRFRDAFCAAPQCSPARAALSTGRYSHSNGVMGLSHKPHSWELPATELHMAKILQAAGYETSLCGLQHVTSNARVSELGFEEHLPGATAREVSANLRTWSDARRQTRTAKPFYLEVGFSDTHQPWNTNPPEWSCGTERVRWLPPYPDSDQEMAQFQGQIYAVDRVVGELLNLLEDASLAADTWVIFTSDHGIALPRAKGTLYDPGIEVPLIMRWPNGGLTGGVEVDGLVSHVDVLPTLVDGLGIHCDSAFQGQSCWRSLAGGSRTVSRSELFAEKTYHTTYDPIRCIRTERHKLIVHFSTYDLGDVPNDAKVSNSYQQIFGVLGAWHPYVELFDLEQDPLEYENVAFEEWNAVLVRELLSRLRAWMIETEDPLLKGMIPSPAYQTALDLLFERISVADVPPRTRPRL